MINLIVFLFLFTCSFQENCFSDSWNRVYLATYPRSGNHWIRALVEEASKIATSSVYPDIDPPHLDNVLPWNGYSTPNGYDGNCRYPKEGEGVFIKTHFPCHSPWPSDLQSSSRTIRIIRHPIDSIYSFYLYDCAGKCTEPSIPKDKLQMYISRWKNFQEYWNRDPQVITFRFEDFYNRNFLAIALESILNVLDYTFTKDDIQRAISKYPPKGTVLQHLKNFSQDDIEMVESELSGLMYQFGYSIPHVKGG